jgi:Ca2+-transporting ATPase
MSFNSFSFRTSAKSLVLRSLDEQDWLDVNILSYMFGNPAVYFELGGLYGLSYRLRSSLDHGLKNDEKDDDYKLRKELYGTNSLPLPPCNPFWRHCLDSIGDPMLIILIIAGCVSVVTGSLQHAAEGGWIEGVAILLAVAIVVFVSSLNNSHQEKAFLKLAATLKGARVTALRHGEQASYEQDEILVGDIVFLNPGAMIPADGVLIDNTTVRVNESALTGESDEIAKSKNDPFMSAGTELADGSCSMLVTATGINSAKGKLMKSIAQAQEQTNLQVRLEHTAKLVGYIGLFCACATFIALLIRWFVSISQHQFDSDGELMTYSDSWDKIIDYFIISVTIIVVAIPEGLPLAVTVSLSYSMGKMRDDQNLVKVLSACETMGNVTAICSDKTGTLTQNKMKIVAMSMGGQFWPHQAERDELSEPLHQLLIDSIICNSDRRVAPEDMDFSVQPEDWKWQGDGGATEAALLSWLSRYHVPPKQGKNIMELRSQERERTMAFYPFSSAKKYSSVLMVPPGSDDPTRCRKYYKGAADRIIKSCNAMIDLDGKVVQLGSLKLPPCQTEGCKRDAMRGDSPTQLTTCDMHSKDNASSFKYDAVCRYTKAGVACNRWAVMGTTTEKQPLYCTDPEHHPVNASMLLLDQHPLKLMGNLTRSGLRCIAFAYVDDIAVEIKDGQLVDPPDSDEPNFTLIGFVGIKDPLRIETKDAVATCQQAGIVVRMVTGDNIDTARFIAQDCGIITHPRHIALEGADFRQALAAQEAYRAKTGENNPDFISLVTNLRVMARCHPEDKLELVKFLKNELNYQVAVTGDGSNDSPALKESHVGLAMGIAGTDVAKAAADIIILDDNFSSIVRSVMWGRCVFDNIRKFLQFQCAVNFCALILALVGAVVDGKEPLKPVQLLWVNLIMDTMGALALGTESPKPSLLQRKPYRPDGPLISAFMWKNIVGQGSFQLLILFLILYKGSEFGGAQYWGTPGQDGYNEKFHYTLIFNTFVWCQFWNEISARKVNAGEFNVFSGFFQNYWFSAILIVTGGMQALMVEVFGSFTSTVSQPWQLWLIAIALGFTQLITGFLLRLIPTPKGEGQITIPEGTFEDAKWLDGSMTEQLFAQYQTKHHQERMEKKRKKELEKRRKAGQLVDEDNVEMASLKHATGVFRPEVVGTIAVQTYY